MKRFLALIGILAILGVGLSAYTAWHNASPPENSFCEIGETFNCTTVGQSTYSEVFGIPVALIGVGGYAFLALAAFLQMRNTKDAGLTTFLLLASSLGMAFSLYLTGIEAFVLNTWCILCIGSQILIALIFFTVLIMIFTQKPYGKSAK